MADPKHPRHYEESFKRQIVQLYENGKPAREIKDEYDISHSTLHRWVQGIRNSGSTKAADNRTPEQNELIELRKRVVPEKLRTLDHGRPWSDDQFASTRLSSNRDMSR